MFTFIQNSNFLNRHTLNILGLKVAVTLLLFHKYRSFRYEGLGPNLAPHDFIMKKQNAQLPRQSMIFFSILPKTKIMLVRTTTCMSSPTRYLTWGETHFWLRGLIFCIIFHFLIAHVILRFLAYVDKIITSFKIVPTLFDFFLLIWTK